MASQNELKKTARQYQIEERRRQVMILLAQGMTEIEIGKKLGVDNSTVSKDIKALKLILSAIYLRYYEIRFHILL